MKKFLLSTIILSALCCFCFLGCDYSLPKAKKAAYSEWTEQNGKMYFRTITAGHGHGYIVLNGKKVNADFTFGLQSSLRVTVLIDDLGDYEYLNETYGETSESFVVSDVNKDGQVISRLSDVVLFGGQFGKVVLTRSEVDRGSVDPWEFHDGWKDSEGHLTLSGAGRGYCTRKCQSAVVTYGGRTEYYTFKWLPDTKQFAMYESRDGEIIEDGEPTLAEGTYSNLFEKVTLTFTKDEIFGGTYPRINLELF